MMFKLSIWYAATINGSPQTHDLTAEEVERYVRPECGFLADMLHLEGKGVRKLMLEVKP
jgi:hypothetical protein